MSKQTACQLHSWSAFAQTVDYFYWNLTMKVNHWINQWVIILSTIVCFFTTRECNVFEFTASEVCDQIRDGMKLMICENHSFDIVMNLWLFEFLSHDVACTLYLNTLSRLIFQNAFDPSSFYISRYHMSSVENEIHMQICMHIYMLIHISRWLVIFASIEATWR